MAWITEEEYQAAKQVRAYEYLQTYQPAFKKVTEKIMTEFSDLNLCPINNKQAIIVDGSESKVICKD